MIGSIYIGVLGWLMNLVDLFGVRIFWKMLGVLIGKNLILLFVIFMFELLFEL